MKRRQRARELPACLQETSTPYMTTIRIHASRNTYVLASHKEVYGLPAKACSRTNLRILEAEARKGRAACSADLAMFKQGLVENHAQTPRKIFVMKGGTANMKQHV